ncbi:hypothetical protein WMF18_03940 [Sorangium sp. So ce315]|uniref:hypothetical protein n=1 Tax=Sorangium sp. So ce315 TaxID=3133299 RepID=UPI003F5E7B24
MRVLHRASQRVFSRTAGVGQTADSFGIVVDQGAEWFTLWCGIQPDTAPRIAALRVA